MALIDVLPEFKYKPLDLEPVKTKLAPKPTMPTVDEVPKEQPKEVTQEPAATMKLPEVYKDMAPLMDALDKSSITNKDAKLAVLAQMGLEKGWKTPKDFSYGNIIAGRTWKGATQVRSDTDAVGNPIKQNFRSYNSADEFVDDYLTLLKNNYPVAYEALHSEGFDVDKFTHGLVGGPRKYAESPTYQATIKKIYASVQRNINNTTV